MPHNSASRIEQGPKKLENPCRKRPQWSRMTPPQAALFVEGEKEPFELILTQPIGGGFHRIRFCRRVKPTTRSRRRTSSKEGGPERRADNQDAQSLGALPFPDSFHKLV